MNEATAMTSETLDRALDSVDETLQSVVLSDVDVLQQASHHIQQPLNFHILFEFVLIYV